MAETFQNGMFEVGCRLANGDPCGVLGVGTCMNGKYFDSISPRPMMRQRPPVPRNT